MLRSFALLVGLVALCGAAPMAWAQHGHGGGRGMGLQDGGRTPERQPAPPQMANPPPMPPPPRRSARDDDSLSDSVRRVERDTGGQVLSAERMQSDGRDINRVKVVDGDGRVRVYMDDPQSRDRGGRRGRDNDN